MAAVLANWGGYYSQRVYLSEARRLGLTVRPPHINYSGRNFVLADFATEGDQPPRKALFMGLDQVKELTWRTIERIIHQRPFHSLEDFLAGVAPRLQEAENLARVGALEGLGMIPSILRRLQGGGSRKRFGTMWQARQPSLFEWRESGGEDWTLEQKVAAQQELLGVSLEAHPLELVAEKIIAAGAVTTVEAAEQTGRRVTVAGIRQSGHRSRTARGELMMFMILEDLVGMLDVVLFPDVYRQARGFIHSTDPLLVSGVVEMDSSRAEPLLRAERVVRVE